MPYNTWGLNEILFQAFQTHLRNQPPGALKGNKMTRKNSLLPLPATQPVLCLTWEIKYCVWGPPELGNLLGMLHVGNRYYYYLCLSTCTVICHLSVYLPTYLSVYLSISVFYQNCSFRTLGASFPRPYTTCPWLPFLSTLLLTAVCLHDSWPPWVVLSLPGTVSLLTGSSSIQGKNWHQGVRTALLCLSLTKCLLRKMDCQLVSNICFLVTVLIYVIRCIQGIFTLCPFIIVLPSILQRKMFLLHNSPYVKTSDKAAARHCHTHADTSTQNLHYHS